jgi:hypothetical protein
VILGKFTKQPAEREAYAIEYEDDLADGDTIIDDPLPTVVITVLGSRVDSAPLTLDAVDVTGTRVTWWLSSGTDGLSYKVTVTASTASGRILQDEVILKIKDF